MNVAEHVERAAHRFRSHPAILFEGKSPRRAIADLMERELKAEQQR